MQIVLLTATIERLAVFFQLFTPENENVHLNVLRQWQNKEWTLKPKWHTRGQRTMLYCSLGRTWSHQMRHSIVACSTASLDTRQGYRRASLGTRQPRQWSKWRGYRTCSVLNWSVGNGWEIPQLRIDPLLSKPQHNRVRYKGSLARFTEIFVG